MRRLAVVASTGLLQTPAIADDCEFGDPFQRWEYDGVEVIVCSFGAIKEGAAEAAWTAYGIKLRARSGDEVRQIGWWGEARGELTLTYAPGQLSVIERTWDYKTRSYTPFIVTTFHQEAGAVRADRALLATSEAYDAEVAAALSAFIVETYAETYSYEEVQDALYRLRDMGLDEPDIVIAELEELKPKIATAAALAEYTQSVIAELEQVRDLD